MQSSRVEFELQWFDVHTYLAVLNYVQYFFEYIYIYIYVCMYVYVVTYVHVHI